MTSVAEGKGIFERRNHVQLWEKKNVHPSVAEISPPESLALKIPHQTILIVLDNVYQCASVCVCVVCVRSCPTMVKFWPCVSGCNISREHFSLYSLITAGNTDFRHCDFTDS